MKEIQSNGKVSELLHDVSIPKMFHARQTFPREMIRPEDIPEVVNHEMGQEQFSSLIKPGMEIAITAGSRGIRNVDIITKAIVDFVKAKGAHPFIVPAMGSHGGATAEGQLEILAGYNITPETMGCPIKSSMEVVELGVSERGRTVYLDKNAYEADGIIVSCRLKPHNAFRGPYESGPCKMMTVGLGKQKGASLVHTDGMDVISKTFRPWRRWFWRRQRFFLQFPVSRMPMMKPGKIEAILAKDIMTREPELLKFAFSNMPKLLVEETDVLVVDEVGKNFSGTGVDPNITGTFSTPYATGGIKVQRTCFLNLSEESHGNALGCGLASAITKKIFDEMDVEKMYPNCITSTVLASARIPCIVANDKEAMQICVRTCNKIDREHARMVRIAKQSSHR